MIKDLEKLADDKARDKILKRKHQEVFGYGEKEDMSSDSEDGGDKLHQLRDRVKNMKLYKGKPEADKGGPARKRDKKEVKKVGKVGGHIFQESGNAYLSKKGKGDVLKTG